MRASPLARRRPNAAPSAAPGIEEIEGEVQGESVAADPQSQATDAPTGVPANSNLTLAAAPANDPGEAERAHARHHGNRARAAAAREGFGQRPPGNAAAQSAWRTAAGAPQPMVDATQTGGALPAIAPAGQASLPGSDTLAGQASAGAAAPAGNANQNAPQPVQVLDPAQAPQVLGPQQEVPGPVDPWAAAPIGDIAQQVAQAGPVPDVTVDEAPPEVGAPGTPAPAGPGAANLEADLGDHAPPIAAASVGTSVSLGEAEGELTDEEKAEQEKRKAEAAAMIGAFLAEGQAKTAELAAAGQAASAQIDSAGQAAASTVQSAHDTQSAALNAHFDAQIARYNTAAATATAQIGAAFDAATQAVAQSAQTARASVEADATAATTQVTAARDAQLAEVDRLYAEAEAAYRAAGADAASTANRLGSTIGGAYQPVESDEDGDLAADRRKAWADAARKKAGEYAEALQKKANEIADQSRTNIETDKSSVRGAAEQAITAINAQKTRALADVTSRETSETQRLAGRRAAAIGQVEAQRGQGVSAAEAARGQATSALDQASAESLRQISTNVSSAKAGQQQGVQRAIGQITTGLNNLRTGVEGAAPPDTAALAGALDNARGQLDAAVSQGTAQISSLAGQMVSGISGAADQTASMLGEHAGQAMSQASAQTDGAISQLNNLASQSSTEAKAMSDAAGVAMQQVATGNKAAVDASANTVTTTYADLSRRLTEGRTANEAALRGKLMEKLVAGGEADQAIRSDARKAAEAVQPWWKTALKWIAIVAVVIVIALVIGPLIVGALAPLIATGAAALGASAAVAGVIGTAIAAGVVGGATGYLTNGIGNLFDGKGFNEGATTAILTGFVGGAVGGAASGLVQQLGGELAKKFVVNMATDVIADQIANVITGQDITFQGVLLSIATAGIMNGASRVKPISDIQTSMTGRGENLANAIAPGSAAHNQVNVPKPAPHTAAPDATTTTPKPHEQAPTADATPTAKPHGDAPAPTAKPTGDAPTTTPKPAEAGPTAKPAADAPTTAKPDQAGPTAKPHEQAGPTTKPVEGAETMSTKPGAQSEGVTPKSSSGKRWDDPDLTQAEFIADYKARHPKTSLSDADLEVRFQRGQRLNEETGRLKKPVRDNGEIRDWYLKRNGEIAEMDAQWKAQGKSPEERARLAQEVRHEARMRARAMMNDKREVANLRARDMEKYGNPDGPTFEQLVAAGRAKGKSDTEIHEGILSSSQRTDQATNDKFGLQGKPSESGTAPSAKETPTPTPKPQDAGPQGPQRARNLDELYEQAGAAQAELAAATREIASATGAKPLIPENLKGRARAQEKVDTEYGGDVSKLTDLARSSLEYRSLDDVYRGLDQLKARFEIVRVKDRFQNPTPEGYRDILVNLRTSNGHVVEVQLHMKQILDVKGGVGHHIYEEIRTIKANAVRENRPLTPEENARVEQLGAQSREAYEAALKPSAGDAGPATPPNEPTMGALADSRTGSGSGAAAGALKDRIGDALDRAKQP